MKSVRRWILIHVLAVGSLTACIVTIDESKIGAKPENPDDDYDDDTTDGGKKNKDSGDDNVEPPRDASKDAVVAVPPVEVGVVLPTSCKDALAKNPVAPTGPTQIDFKGAALTVFCDQTSREGGWTMLFRLSAGPGLTGDPYDIYNNFGVNDTVATEVTPAKTNAHYNSRILSQWNVPSGFPVADAMVRVYKATAPVKEVVFQAAGSNFSTFFAPARIVDSSWNNDLKPTTEFSDFAIAGRPQLLRRFNIHRTYSTCETDTGWLVAHGSVTGEVACDNYELPADHIRIYYAREFVAQKWVDHVEDADSLAVFAR